MFNNIIKKIEKLNKNIWFNLFGLFIIVPSFFYAEGLYRNNIYYLLLSIFILEILNKTLQSFLKILNKRKG